MIAKQATRYRAAVQQAENAAQAATRAEKRAAEAGERAEAREGQAQALDKLLDAKKAELERLDRTIEQRRGHGRDGPSFWPALTVITAPSLLKTGLRQLFHGRCISS